MVKVNQEALNERARALYTIPHQISAEVFDCLFEQCQAYYDEGDEGFDLNKPVHEIPPEDKYLILSCTTGFNGIRMLLVEIESEIESDQAILKIHFFNRNSFQEIFEAIEDGSIDTFSLFPISGGERLIAGDDEGQVKVMSIVDAGEGQALLRLTVQPIGDYSTYTLAIDREMLPDIDPIFSDIDFKFRPGCFSIECDPDWEAAPAPRDNPVIDYLAKDYDSFKHTLITAMMQRVPGWQPSSEADLDMVLIELFSAAADELSDYQDRVMNEAYLGTARKRVSIARHARLMDYHIHQGNQASTWLAFRVNSYEVVDGYELNLISIDGVDELLDNGSSLVILALVRHDLHIRIFDSYGEKIIDKTERELVSGDVLRELKHLLNTSTGEDSLSEEVKEEIIKNALSISGHFLIDTDLVVGTGIDLNNANSVIFKSRRRYEEFLHHVKPLFVHHLLNNLGLYTWSHSVPTLAAGSTSADLLLYREDSVEPSNQIPVTDEASAETVKNLISEGFIEYLLIQEWLNPATGRMAGRNPNKRQLLKLLPGEDGAEVLHDPVEDVHFVRAHWQKRDALQYDYCFYVDFEEGAKENVSLFHGNLVEVFHGRPAETVFKDSGVDKLFLFNMPEGTPDPSQDGFLNALRERLDEANIQLSHSIRVFGSEIDNVWLVEDEATHSAYRIELEEDKLRVYLWYLEDYLDYFRTEKKSAICRLPAGPLAYQETPLGGEIAPKSTLEVQVISQNRVDPWEETISLVHSDGSIEGGDHFAVETDEYGESLLRFGNGTNGMELPEYSVVRCSYQVGLGLDGNIGADTLTAFDTSEYPFIENCWNPFDVTNGRTPEPVEEIIRKAPEAYRSRQLRAITLDDYIKRAEELEEVSKAAADYAWTGSWRTVQITIDPVGATELSPALRQKISRHLNAVRLIGEDLEIRGPRYVPLDITINLCIHSDYWVEDIRAYLKKEFSEGYTPDGRKGFFHPDRWTFGQELRASEIIGRVQRVKGVDHVREVLMKRWNDPATATNEITDVAFNEIIRVRNHPDFTEEGYIEFNIGGGRQ